MGITMFLLYVHLVALLDVTFAGRLPWNSYDYPPNPPPRHSYIPPPLNHPPVWSPPVYPSTPLPPVYPSTSTTPVYPAPSLPPTIYENNESNLLEIVKALTARVDSMSNQLVAAIEKQIELGAQAHEEVIYYEKEKLQLMHREGEQGAKQHNEEIHLLRRIVKSCYPPPSPVYPPPPAAPHPTTAAPHPRAPKNAPPKNDKTG